MNYNDEKVVVGPGEMSDWPMICLSQYHNPALPFTAFCVHEITRRRLQPRNIENSPQEEQVASFLRSHFGPIIKLENSPRLWSKTDSN